MLFHERYKKEIAPKLKEKLGLKNIMLVPKIEKIVVNATTGEALQNPKLLESIAAEFVSITGQKPVIRRAKKSIATYKLREGQPIGVSVTLRNRLMYEFFNRLVNVALPRTRDFKGLSKKSFDGQGNYTLGITEQIIFPEIMAEKVEKIRGLSITIATSTKSDAHALELLTALGFPFRA